MINFEAFFKMSYGLYIVATGNKEKGNGFVANAVFQVTAEPPQVAVCCNKDNFSFDFLQKSEGFSISILGEGASADLIGTFGFKSGKETDKFEGCNIIYGSTGTPIVLDGAVSYLECKLVSSMDVGTHLIFIGEVIAGELTGAKDEPLTYANYRRIRKGLAPKNAPTYIDKSKVEAKKETTDAKTYECGVCGYNYDEAESGVKFEDLPEDWTCPICGMGKDEFSLV